MTGDPVLPIGTTEPARETAPRNRRFVFGLLGLLALVVAAAFFARSETRQSERDYHAILRHITEMERLIRAHDQGIWLHVEGGGHGGASPRSGAEEKVHDAMLRDFDRLGHLEGFAIRDVQIEIHDDVAVARYRVEGSARRDEPLPPAAGEMRFRRTAAGWEMIGHRLIEQP